MTLEEFIKELEIVLKEKLSLDFVQKDKIRELIKKYKSYL